MARKDFLVFSFVRREPHGLNNEHALESNTFLFSNQGLDPQIRSRVEQWVFAKFKMPATGGM